MKNKGSTPWLIIFLCALIFGFYSLWGYNWHLRKIKDLQGQIEELKNKIEQIKTQKNYEQFYPSLNQISTPSAIILPSVKPTYGATNSGNLNGD